MRPRAGVVDRVPEAHQSARHVGAREVGVGRRRATVVGLEVLAADLAGVGAETGQDDPAGAGRVVAGVGDGVVHPFFQRLAGRRVGHDHRRLRRSTADDRLVGNRGGDLELGDFGAGRERAAAAVAEELVVDHIVDAERAVGDPADRDVVVHQRVVFVDLERLEFHRRRRIAGVVVAVAVVGVEAEERKRHRAGDVLRGRERTRLAARLAGPCRLKPAVEAALERHPLVVGIGVVAALRLGVACPCRAVLAVELEEEVERFVRGTASPRTERRLVVGEAEFGTVDAGDHLGAGRGLVDVVDADPRGARGRFEVFERTVLLVDRVEHAEQDRVVLAGIVADADDVRRGDAVADVIRVGDGVVDALLEFDTGGQVGDDQCRGRAGGRTPRAAGPVVLDLNGRHREVAERILRTEHGGGRGPGRADEAPGDAVEEPDHAVSALRGHHVDDHFAGGAVSGAEGVDAPLVVGGAGTAADVDVRGGGAVVARGEHTPVEDYRMVTDAVVYQPVELPGVGGFLARARALRAGVAPAVVVVAFRKVRIVPRAAGFGSEDVAVVHVGDGHELDFDLVVGRPEAGVVELGAGYLHVPERRHAGEDGIGNIDVEIERVGDGGVVSKTGNHHLAYAVLGVIRIGDRVVARLRKQLAGEIVVHFNDRHRGLAGPGRGFGDRRNVEGRVCDGERRCRA